MKSPALFIISLILIIGLSACADGNTQGAKNSNKTFSLKVQPPEGSTTKIVTYERATVYTGSTDYYFNEASGQGIKIRQSNFEANPFSMPDDLLESTGEIEGPPGANPNMIGKQFKLTYDKEGEIIKVIQL